MEKHKTKTLDKGGEDTKEGDGKAGLKGAFVTNKGFPGGRNMGEPVGFSKIKGPSIAGK